MRRRRNNMVIEILSPHRQGGQDCRIRLIVYSAHDTNGCCLLPKSPAVILPDFVVFIPK